MRQAVDPFDVSVFERRRGNQVPFKHWSLKRKRTYLGHAAIARHENSWPMDQIEIEIFLGEAWARWAFQREGCFPVWSGTNACENFYWIFCWEGGTSNEPIPSFIEAKRSKDRMHSAGQLEAELKAAGLL